MGDEYAKIGRVTTESVFKCTGKHWHEWIAILDKVGARSWSHQEVVAFLKKKYKLGPWWQQGVTSGFELAIGRRVEGQNAKGTYTVTATKSLHVSASKAWKEIVSEKGLKAWLKPFSPLTVKPGSQFETTDGFFGEIRTMQKGRRIRMTWQDPNWERKTVVEVIVVARANGNSIVGFNHSEIRDPKTLARMRARWKAAANELQGIFIA